MDVTSASKCEILTTVAMFPPIPQMRLKRLLGGLFSRGGPHLVHVAAEQGSPWKREPFSVIESPRLSLCLGGIGRYLSIRDGSVREVGLRRGDVIFAPPRGTMEPHPTANYLSFGIVFTPHLIRYLIASKHTAQPGHSGHHFLLTHHSQTTLDEDALNLCRAIARAAARPPDDAYLRSLVNTLLVRTQEFLGQPESPTPHGKAFFTWQAACQFTQEHLHKPLSRKDVAAFLRVHPNHISRLFAQFSNESFSQYVQRIRIQRSEELLRNPILNISDVSLMCGFTDVNYFIRCYRKTHGTSPGKARRLFV